MPVDLWIYGRRPMKECRSLLDIATTQITITRILRFMFNCSNVWVRRPGVSHTPTSKRQLWRSAEVCRRHHCARMWHKYLRSDMVQRWILLFGFVGYGIGLCLCFLFTPYMFFVVVVFCHSFICICFEMLTFLVNQSFHLIYFASY